MPQASKADLPLPQDQFKSCECGHQRSVSGRLGEGNLKTTSVCQSTLLTVLHSLEGCPMSDGSRAASRLPTPREETQLKTGSGLVLQARLH